MIPFLFIYSNWALLLLRVVLGLILLAHGLPKVKNLRQTADYFSSMKFRPGIFWAGLVAGVEIIGGAAIILGFFAQFFASLVLLQFAVILLIVKRKAGFKGGIEFDLIIAATAFMIATSGAGPYSLDHYFGILLY